MSMRRFFLRTLTPNQTLVPLAAALALLWLSPPASAADDAPETEPTDDTEGGDDAETTDEPASDAGEEGGEEGATEGEDAASESEGNEAEEAGDDSASAAEAVADEEGGDSGDDGNDGEGDEAEAAPPAPPFKPSFELHLYTDLGMTFDDSSGKFAAQFALGGINLNGRARFSARIDAMAELLFEMTPDRAPVARLNRLFASYHLHTAANLRMGRFFSPIGYFVTHHEVAASVFFPTHNLPRLLDLSSKLSMIHGLMEGGELYGSAALGKFGEFKYNVAGGFAHGASPVALGRVALAPGGPLAGLELGATFSVHRGSSSGASDLLSLKVGGKDEDEDEDEEQTDLSSETDDSDEKDVDSGDVFSVMTAGYAAYNSGPIESVVEFYYVRNSPNFLGEGHDLIGAWGMLGVTIKRLTPFARYEYWKRAEEDSFYNAGGAPSEWNELTAGVRLTLTPQIVIKAAYSHRFHDNTNVGVVQVGLGF